MSFIARRLKHPQKDRAKRKKNKQNKTNFVAAVLFPKSPSLSDGARSCHCAFLLRLAAGEFDGRRALLRAAAPPDLGARGRVAQRCVECLDSAYGANSTCLASIRVSFFGSLGAALQLYLFDVFDTTAYACAAAVLSVVVGVFIVKRRSKKKRCRKKKKASVKFWD